MIDTSTNTVVKSIPILIGSDPEDITVDPSGAFVYVLNFEGGTVSKIDTASNTIVATLGPFSVGPPSFLRALGLVVHPDNTRLYVTLREAARLIEIDPSTGSFTTIAQFTNTPVDIKVHPNGNVIYVAIANPANVVKVIDAVTYVEAASIPIPSTALSGLALSPDGTRLYVGGATGATVA